MPWMRPLALSLALVMAPAIAHAGELTTRDVVELHRAGLGEEVLLALIQVDGGPFELSPTDALDLKAEGLPERVIAALIRAGRSQQAHMEAPHLSDEHGVPDTTQVTETWITYETHDTEVVAVPVPVYVPVAHPHRRGRLERVAPVEQVPGVRRGRATGALGTAPGIAGQPPVTVDDIRRAPPGFHPGSIGPRANDRDAAAGSGSRGAAREPTPGVVRSADRSSDSPSTPGVARSRRQ